jgi:hypothetical protein
MCPFCKQEDQRDCRVKEQPNGRLACECGKHSWPNSAVYIESCRRANLTIVGRTHIWTQAF